MYPDGSLSGNYYRGTYEIISHAVSTCSDGIQNQDENGIDCGGPCQPCCTDADGDGFKVGGANCGPADCNDNDPAIHPGAIELCDGKDNDCDEQIDEDLSWDADGDGHYRLDSCQQPADDCNDGNPTIYPGAPEVCDGKDDNCNGLADEGLSWDADGDGHYRTGSCLQPADDCNDRDPATYPGASDTCDGKDNNCDGQVDEGCCPQITSFSGSSAILDPTAGGSVTFSFTVDQAYDSATIAIDGEEIGGATWNGLLSGKLAVPGTHTAVLTVKKGDCTVTDDVKVTVEEYEGCQLKVTVGSSANVASGKLTDSLGLFSVPGTGPSLALHYGSLDPFAGSLGLGWSHSFDIYLAGTEFGEIVLHEGSGTLRLYTPAGAGYVSQAGDANTLSRQADGTFLLGRKDGTRYRFGSDARIASIADRNGNVLAFAYVGSLLQSVTDGAGRAITFSYDSAGKLTSVTDPAGNAYRFTVGESLSSVTFPDGATWSYGYDEGAFLTVKTDPLGNLTTYAYDGEHRVIESADPEGRIRTIAYPGTDETVRTTTFTEKDGGAWRYTYDTAAGDLLAKTDPEGNTTSYTYDGNHNTTSKTDASGTTYYTYAAAGNLTSVTDVAGQTTNYAYNAFGQVTRVTDPEGHVTAYEYDAKGNLTKTIDPTGAATSYTYDSAGHVISVSDALGRTTAMTYDAAGNMTGVTDPAGNAVRYEYDANGRMIRQTDPQGNATTFEYDARGNLIKIIDPLGNATFSTFDAKGNKVGTTDANGNVTRYEYNAQGQMVKQTDAEGNVTTYAYGGSACPSCGGGNGEKLTSLTDANGHATAFEYDSLGRLVRETDPLGNETTYSYDARGNLTSRTDANGATIHYGYDSLGRLVKKSYPDGTEEAFTYDAKGNLISAANANASYAFTYDAAGRATSVGDGDGRVIQYRYDAAGRKTETIYPEGSIVSHVYDASGRLKEIHNGGGRVYRFAYDTAGRRSTLTLPNGVVATYSYDGAGRLTDLTHKAATGTIIAGNGYTLDQTGNRLSHTTPERTLSYSYDATYRLTEALSSTPGNSANATGKGKGIATATQQQKEFYTYDPVGNRLSSEKTPLYSYSAVNQLLTNGGSYRYDNNGNLIEKTTDEGATTYAWDYENRLVKVAMPDGSVVEFKYDPLGRRIEKAATENGSTTVTRYVYDNEDIVLEYDGSGTLGNKYGHGPGIDEPLAVTQGKETYFYQADGLGSIVALTDKSGKVVQDYQYDSFGNLKDLKNRIKQPYTYTGREFDRETGLYCYRARYYDAAAGRFVSKDPIGFRGGNNFYLYVQANPVVATDPFGLKTYMCKKFLHALGGTGQRTGPDIWGNPLYHQYICVITPDGKEVCGGQDRTGGAWSPGRPSEDYFSPQYCTLTDPDDECLESCLTKAILSSSRPFYGLFGPGTNCQEWADDTYATCKSSTR